MLGEADPSRSIVMDRWGRSPMSVLFRGMHGRLQAATGGGEAQGPVGEVCDDVLEKTAVILRAESAARNMSPHSSLDVADQSYFSWTASHTHSISNGGESGGADVHSSSFGMSQVAKASILSTACPLEVTRLLLERWRCRRGVPLLEEKSVRCVHLAASAPPLHSGEFYRCDVCVCSPGEEVDPADSPEYAYFHRDPSNQSVRCAGCVSTVDLTHYERTKVGKTVHKSAALLEYILSVDPALARKLYPLPPSDSKF
mmetsp:Transcript_23553/g.69733  ORF Transcript_23553/g.69733 Transcript_23553/m.69733 type:complete len:256 (+) Transcript_23553:1536-2303(+)